MTGLATVLAILARAGIQEQQIDTRTIEYYLRHGYAPHRIATEIFCVPVSCVHPQEAL